MSSILNDYQTLDRLLSTQGEALRNGDFQKLAALTPLLSRSSDRVAQYTDCLDTLGSEEKNEVQQLIAAVADKVADNRARLQQHYADLVKARINLRAAQQFARSAGSRRSNGSHLFDRLS